LCVVEENESEIAQLNSSDIGLATRNPQPPRRLALGHRAEARVRRRGAEGGADERETIYSRELRDGHLERQHRSGRPL
jgi:hypothetical protein